jgi:hypothetical protein
MSCFNLSFIHPQIAVDADAPLNPLIEVYIPTPQIL